MNCYKISHKVNTLAHLFKKFEYKGFIFSPYGAFCKGRQYQYNEDWFVEKNIESVNFKEAIRSFKEELLPILSKCSTVSQCYFGIMHQPYMVLKMNNNPNNIFYLYLTQDSGTCGLPFGEEELDSLKKLETFPPDREQCFLYLNESTNAISYYTRLAILIVVLESIAGEAQNGRRIETNKEYIKNEIIKDHELYNKIYRHGSGIRNKIFHGKNIDFGIDYVSKIYDKLVDYFNNKYDTKIKQDIEGPQRTIYGNFLLHRYFYFPNVAVGENNLDFKQIIQCFEDDVNTSQYLPVDKEELKIYCDKY